MCRKSRGSEAIIYEPVLDYAWCHFGRDLTNPTTYPFAIFWGISSSGWREEAQMASKGSECGLNFLYERRFKRKAGPTRGGGAWSTRVPQAENGPCRRPHVLGELVPGLVLR